MSQSVTGREAQPHEQRIPPQVAQQIEASLSELHRLTDATVDESHRQNSKLPPDPPADIELKVAAAKRTHRTTETPDVILEAVERAAMDPQHAALDELLK